METLLTRLKEKLGTEDLGCVLKVSKCNEALARACKAIGISKLIFLDNTTCLDRAIFQKKRKGKGIWK